MISHPQVQQVTPQVQHQRSQQPNMPAPQNQRQGGPRQPQQQMQNLPAQVQAGGITHDQMMLINSMQALMGTGQQRSTSNSRQKNKKFEKKRLPSLHIGNLPQKFYDLDLFKMIKQRGFAVVKALVVVDKKTNKSLNYGYAQFATEQAAAECQKALNNAVVEDKVITVSLQQTENKPNPKANVLVRNLAASVTQKQIYDLYAKFGEIQKCKLECFADGLSRGFAYVQFAQEKDAAEAIAKTNGSDFEGKKLEVFAHVKRAEQPAGEGEAKTQGNNVFVQGFAKGTTEKQLAAMFAEFGDIVNSMVQRNDSDDSLSNSGYVCFKNAQSATSAVQKLNKQKTPQGSYLFVSHHVAKRQNELASDKTKTAINQNINKNFASNLFVKFVPAEVSEALLTELFKPHGAIISVKIKVKEGSRYNHAYVLYERVESCQQAIRALDKSRPFGNQPIDVEFWVSKVDLVAERESKQKEQMQKYISSAIYDIRNELMGGRKPFRGGKRNNQHRGGTTGGRGGKPMSSTERKGSKEPRAKSNGKEQQAKSGTPAAAVSGNTQYVQVPLPPADMVAQIAAIPSLNEKKQFIGNLIYPCIQAAYGEQFVGKITGMLLDEKVVNLDLLVSNQKYLSEIAGQAKNMLEQQAKQ